MNRIGLSLFVLVGVLCLVFFLQQQGGDAPQVWTEPATANPEVLGELKESVSQHGLDNHVPRMDREQLVVPSASGENSRNEERVITLRTVLEDGTPVGGVSVYAYQDEAWSLDPRGRDLPNQDPDPVLLAKTIGELFITDAAGIAVLPEKYMEAGLMAISGDLVGLDWRLDEYEVEIRMVENRTVSICALHENGKPAEGIDVGVFQVWAGTEDLVWPNATARTSADGCVKIEHLNAWFGAGSKEAAVGVVGLFRKPIATMLDPNNPPEETMVLTLPGYGSVQVQLAEGVPYLPDKEYLVEVVIDPDPQAGRNLQQLKVAFDDSDSLELYSFLRAGSASLPCIGLGLDLLIHIRQLDGLDSTYLAVRGPSEPGEHLIMEIAPLLEEKHILLRMEGPDGQPKTDTEFQFHLARVEGGNWTPRALVLRSDANGDVDFIDSGSLFLGSESLKSLAMEAALLLDPVSSSLMGRLLVQPKKLELSNRIGTMTLSSDELLVSGRVIGLTARELMALELEVEQRVSADLAAPSSWEEYQRAFCDDRGNFICQFPANPAIGLLRIAPPQHEAYHRYDSFEVGDEHLVLDYGTGFELAGRVRLEPDFDTSLLSVEFRSDTSEGNRGLRSTTNLQEDGSFRLTGLHRDLGKVKVKSRRGFSTLHTIEDVMPYRAGEGADARLLSIDLAGKLNPMEIFVEGGAGVQPTYVSVHIEGGVFGQTQWRPDERIILVTTEPSLHAVIGAPGFALKEVDLLPGRNYVVLDPGLEVEFVLDGMRDLPSEITYKIGLVSARFRGPGFELEDVKVPSDGKFMLTVPCLGRYSWSVDGEVDGRYVFGFTMLGESKLVEVAADKPTHLLLPVDWILERVRDS